MIGFSGWARTLGVMALCAASAPGAAWAQGAADPISARVAERGVNGALTELEAAASPSPEQRFAIGGLRFLSAIERVLQARWRVAAESVDFAPVLRLPVPPNPNPEPFDPAMVEQVLTEGVADLAAAISALSAVPDGPMTLRLDLRDLWFDIDGNGARAARGEDLLTAAQAVGMPLRPGAETKPLMVAFDRADVAWLSAYAHLLSGLAELALSIDPVSAMLAAAPGWEAEAQFGRSDFAAQTMGAEPTPLVDQFAPLLLMLRGKPIAAHTQAALSHLRAMIADNRQFWVMVIAETDDDAEWIPNPTQKAALGGVTLDAATAAAWTGVLDDADRMLAGELLVPHWRYGPEQGETAGVNLRRVLEAPTTFDPVLWIQGAAAAPYLERGPLISDRSWNNFARLASGDALLFAMWLN